MSVEATGVNEVQFLSALLNTPRLHDAFIAARKTDRAFHLPILDKIPLPRFDTTNSTHQAIVKLSKKCKVLAQETYEPHPDYGDFKMRATIRTALQEAGYHTHGSAGGGLPYARLCRRRATIRTALQEAGLQQELRTAITETLPKYMGRYRNGA